MMNQQVKPEIKGCSIIIPTFNRVDHLKKCISSLKKLNFNEYEIIVIDDNSSDETGEYLNQITGIKVIKNKTNLGPSRSRNIGAIEARFNLIAFIDDDCIADKNWLKKIEFKFTNRKNAFVIGQTFYINRDYKGSFPERLVSNINSQWPMSSNIVFDRDIFLKNGGFSHKFYGYKNEDTELAIRLLSKGYLFNRNNNMVVYHQKSIWTAGQLLKTANNLSVWPVLKKKYPRHYLSFKPSNIKLGIFINPEDYLLVLFWPLLFLRYILKGGRNLGVFFTKWPLLIILRRYLIFKEAIINRVIMF